MLQVTLTLNLNLIGGEYLYFILIEYDIPTLHFSSNSSTSKPITCVFYGSIFKDVKTFCICQFGFVNIFKVLVLLQRFCLDNKFLD